MNYFALDVECALGEENQLIPISIALVDQYENILINTLVSPSSIVTDYLTTIHGIKREQLEKAPSLPSCLKTLRNFLATNSILVGQSIDKDIEYLKLIKGRDFADSVDISLYFALPPTLTQDQLRSIPRRFTLEQTVRHLLSAEQFHAHNPVEDAKYSMRLYLKYRDSAIKREEAKSILRDIICPEKKSEKNDQRSPDKNNAIVTKNNSQKSKEPQIMHHPNYVAIPRQHNIPPNFVPFNYIPPRNDFRKDIPKTPQLMPPIIIQIPVPIQLMPQIQESFMQPSVSPIQFKMAILRGRISELTTKVKLIGKPNVKHVVTIQSQDQVCIEKILNLEPIEFFSFQKIKESMVTEGFHEVAFQGTVETIQRAIDTLRKVSPNSEDKTLFISLHLVPCEAYVFVDDHTVTDNEKLESIFFSVVSPPSEDRFGDWMNNFILKYPELKPSKKNPSFTVSNGNNYQNKSEWSIWMDLLESKNKTEAAPDFQKVNHSIGRQFFPPNPAHFMPHPLMFPNAYPPNPFFPPIDHLYGLPVPNPLFIPAYNGNGVAFNPVLQAQANFY